MKVLSPSTMRPRSKLEHEVYALSSKLPPISPSAIEWGRSHVMKAPTAYGTKHKCWCTECGSSFEHDSTDSIICPHCGEKLTFAYSKRWRKTDTAYYTVMQTFRGYQVIRHYWVKKVMRRGEEAAFEFNEAVQSWISPSGKETIMARDQYMYGGWVFDKEMSIKHEPRYYYGSQKYTIYAYHIYPHLGLLPIVRRNGFTLDVKVAPQRLVVALLSDHNSEVMVKSGQYRLLERHIYRSLSEECLTAMKICNRNRYFVDNADKWCDMVAMQAEHGCDIHNRKFVCPDDIVAEHDRWCAIRRRERERELRKKRIEEAASHEDAYREKNQKYFGICFGNEHIVVKVIGSVAEMAEEGDAMHHCVYEASYYKRDNSLILSAKDLDGNRIETIEVDTKNFSVVQSRGVCNSSTKYHEEIIDLVNRNMNLIKMAV